ncbi:MAG: anhydro-N-acetylmuramic acid kinase [Saprospiraceae bacterium]|nr:anhydro-N-acetylmuramic acid kinase [Saprospiraceae bacterium]
MPANSVRKVYRGLGLMSGSSMDGIDLALCRLVIKQPAPGRVIEEWQLEHCNTHPLPDKWKDRLKRLPDASARDISRDHTAFGRFLASVVQPFIARCPHPPDFISLHGHTIFHEPEAGFTLQLGDGETLAALTGYTVVDDFRKKDIAAGGQGTPLAPIADQMLFWGRTFYLNLGGIVNISCVSQNATLACDITGGNQLLDYLARQLGAAFDAGGELARNGEVIPALIDLAEALPYHQQSYPKSLDNRWVRESLIPVFDKFEAGVEDKLNSACRFIARQIARMIANIKDDLKLDGNAHVMMVSGGGAKNLYLLDCIRAECPTLELEVPEDVWVDYKEASLMALMGVLRLEGVPNCLASATGASMDTVGGAVHWGWRKNTFSKHL